MADPGYVNSLLNTLETSAKRTLTAAFTYVLGNLTFGPMDDARRKATNFLLYRYDATTSSVVNQEFSIAHGLGRAPVNIIPVVRAQEIGSRLVRLEVTRAADAQRVYLSSPDTNAAFTVLLEG